MKVLLNVFSFVGLEILIKKFCKRCISDICLFSKKYAEKKHLDSTFYRPFSSKFKTGVHEKEAIKFIKYEF